ncbi:MAG: T9SS type A sorting domain-containing protein [Bacteroidales bacterium]|nr:T9SS type A sorting domain-containing protein [Bacteroidales bacterium]
MRNKKLKLCAAILLSLGVFGLHAQEAMNSTGGNITGSGGSVSYSLGQLFYHVNEGTNASLTEGIQQPYEISVITGVKDIPGVTIGFKAYPNPVTNHIILETGEPELRGVSFQLFDMQGQMLQKEKITGHKTTIETASLLPATYFIKVLLNNNEVQVFKIIKK